MWVWQKLSAYKRTTLFIFLDPPLGFMEQLKVSRLQVTVKSIFIVLSPSIRLPQFLSNAHVIKTNLWVKPAELRIQLALCVPSHLGGIFTPFFNLERVNRLLLVNNATYFILFYIRTDFWRGRNR